MKTEDIVLDVRVRHYCGTEIARCNGKTASCTSQAVFAVERVAEKAIAVIADQQSDPSIAKRPRDIKSLGHGVWKVTYKAPEVKP